MITVIVLTLLLAGVAAVGTVRALFTDGYRRVPTDPSRIP
ncbi:hypothetical protein C7474_2787 [Microbacterium telephonicum]|uniref:Uncharacterized protein n=1 Tax=Microbacterium telephonicum TaxID=1714841 RepID=A0A498BR78_9MICO|nr:hypothetical protein C7474_2787 [Microbacterium telephonicum]